MNNEKQHTPELLMQAYDAIVAESMAEIQRLTGGLKQHLDWWGQQQAGNAAVLDGFTSQVRESRGKIPLPCFRTLVNLGTALQRHVWMCYLHKDELPNALRTIPSYGRPN